MLNTKAVPANGGQVLCSPVLGGFFMDTVRIHHVFLIKNLEESASGKQEQTQVFEYYIYPKCPRLKQRMASWWLNQPI